MNKEKIPEFDELIFENRNKSYGAYQLRKSYKSVASISILAGIFIGVSLVTSLSFTVKENYVVPETMRSGVIVMEKYKPDFAIPEVPDAPVENKEILRNLRPVIVEDTTGFVTEMMTVTEIEDLITDRVVADTSGAAPVDVDPVIPDEPEVRFFVEEKPEFPGGEAELLRFISLNLDYPAEAVENNIQGRVFVKFVVNADGSVDRIEVIKGVDDLLDAEAVRVIRTLPSFKPGRQNGVAVPVWFTIPVSFQIK